MQTFLSSLLYREQHQDYSFLSFVDNIEIISWVLFSCHKRTRPQRKMDRCETCQRIFGERCPQDNRITLRCGGCTCCSRIRCCRCELGADTGSSASEPEPESSQIATPRTRGRRETPLSRGEHGWNTTHMELDELLTDGFSCRQRVWGMTALLQTPEKKQRPKKARRRRRR